REVTRVQGALADHLRQLSAEPAQAAGRPKAPWWERWFARPPAELPPPELPAREGAAPAEQLVAAVIARHTTSLQPGGRAPAQHGLEMIPCESRLFDPERMEVVEAVADSGRPPSEVIDVVRPGYLWRGRVFRYAQVRVARS